MSRSLKPVSFIDLDAEIEVIESTDADVVGGRHTIQSLCHWAGGVRFSEVIEPDSISHGNLLIEVGAAGCSGYYFAEGRPVRSAPQKRPRGLAEKKS